MNINVTGIDPYVLLAALHNASRVSNTFFCLSQERGDITAEEAKVEAEKAMYPRPVTPYPDYLFGRPIKTFLRQDGDQIYLMRVDLYDRDVGEGAAQHVVDSILGGE
jgi:hypothetical protein|tara:strand:+ start:103 stop:423 length:321 start_codon:yes stop_codon:yes gene_type:complete